MQIFKICHHHLIPHFWTASTKSQNQHHLTPTVADNPKLNNLVDCDTYATCGARFSVINAQSCIITETVKQLPHNVAKHGLAYAQYVCIFTFPTVKTVACFFVNIVKVLDIVKCNYTPTAMMPFTSCSDVHNTQGGTYLYTDRSSKFINCCRYHLMSVASLTTTQSGQSSYFLLAVWWIHTHHVCFLCVMLSAESAKITDMWMHNVHV